MRNIKVTVEYDGTNYHGFQVQGKMPTIQAVLQDAIERITGTRAAVTGAGRTDAGVHARGQVINFKTHSRIPTERFAHALNSVLPDDVVAVSAEEVPQDFHSRYSATSKVYGYTFWNAEFPSPFWRAYALWVRQELDVDAMRAAAGDFTGRHDFAAFRSTGSSAVTTVRTVFRSTVQASKGGSPGRGRLVVFTVEADGFLYNMVRIMAGTLLEVGIGKRGPGDVRLALAEPSRGLAGPTLPPNGLCLEEVRYGATPGRGFP
ncbi:MAG: tRNA pseudouridine(38-40) synthase TruA [Ignavibacteriales bacterium]